MSNFSTRLKALRKEKGLSQLALANQLGIGQTSIASYESASRLPSLEVFISIGKFFGVSLDYLIGTIKNGEDFSSNFSQEITLEGEKYLAFLLKGKKQEAFDYIEGLVAEGWLNIEIYQDVFTTVLWKIGDLWEIGEISVGEEHYISNATLEIIRFLHSKKKIKEEYNDKILMATVEDDEHMIGLKIMENLLLQSGYSTYFLGCKTVASHLVEIIKQKRIKIIVLSITMKACLGKLERSISLIRKRIPEDNVKILVVGQGIKEDSNMVYKFGANAYGETFQEVLNIMKKWIKN